jgi:ribosomal protein S27AE
MSEETFVMIEADCECGQHVRIRAVAGHADQRWACPKCGKRYARLPRSAAQASA